jgi:hypothetical protein
MATPYDHAAAAETLFHPLANPDRREQDPMRALVAAHDLRILLGLAELGAVKHARHQGWTWAQIAEVSGITRQAAHVKWSALVGCDTDTIVEEVDEVLAHAAALGRPDHDPWGTGLRDGGF